MFKQNGESNIYTVNVDNELRSKVKDTMGMLYQYTNDSELYSRSQDDTRRLQTLSSLIVDKFISEYIIDTNDSVTIIVTIDKNTFRINLTKYPEESLLKGHSYNIEY